MVKGNNVGRRIKARRQELGITQEELAKKMGYSSRSAINKIEMGVNDLNQTKIKKFSIVLDCSIAYLMGWDTEAIESISRVTQDANDYDDSMELIDMIKELNLSKEDLEQVYSYAKYLASQKGE